MVEYGQEAIRQVGNQIDASNQDGHIELERASKYAQELGRRDVLCEVLQILGRYEYAQGNIEKVVR